MVCSPLSGERVDALPNRIHGGLPIVPGTVFTVRQRREKHWVGVLAHARLPWEHMVHRLTTDLTVKQSTHQH